MKYFISYDISSDRKRNKASKILEDYGIRIQYSLFECELDKDRYLELKEILVKLISKKTDSLLFLDVCERCMTKKEFVGADFNVKKLSFLSVD